MLFGASLGGLIAYFILPQARRRLVRVSTGPPERQAVIIIRRVSIEITGALGAILLSAIITILLARISETQFVIRVTVNDFWGAVAIGFAANYVGARLFSKLLQNESDK